MITLKQLKDAVKDSSDQKEIIGKLGLANHSSLRYLLKKYGYKLTVKLRLEKE